MTIECYTKDCVHHYFNSTNPNDEGPFCDQLECRETHSILFERFSFQLSLEVAKKCSHAGDCAHEVAQALAMPEVRQQLGRIKPSLLRAELREYGAWEEDQLQDYEDNLARILWIASSNLVEKVGD